MGLGFIVNIVHVSTKQWIRYMYVHLIVDHSSSFLWVNSTPSSFSLPQNWWQCLGVWRKTLQPSKRWRRKKRQRKNSFRWEADKLSIELCYLLVFKGYKDSVVRISVPLSRFHVESVWCAASISGVQWLVEGDGELPQVQHSGCEFRSNSLILPPPLNSLYLHRASPTLN